MGCFAGPFLLIHCPSPGRGLASRCELGCDTDVIVSISGWLRPSGEVSGWPAPWHSGWWVGEGGQVASFTNTTLVALVLWPILVVFILSIRNDLVWL